MDGPTIADAFGWLEQAGVLAGALLALWAVLHLMIVAPLKRYLTRTVRGPLVRLERKLELHISDHPGPSSPPAKLRPIRGRDG